MKRWAIRGFRLPLMGQGSSQPAERAHNDQEEESQLDTNIQIPDSQPETSNAVFRPNEESQNAQESARKRKRKSSNLNSQPNSPAVIDNSNDKSQGPQGDFNRTYNQKLAKDDSNMVLAQAANDQSPQTPRRRLVDLLEKKAASQPNGSAEPETSKAQKRPSKKRNSQAIQSEPVTPRKALKSDQDRNQASVASSISNHDLLAKGKPRPKQKAGVGHFSPVEVETLESFKLDFCNMNNCSTVIFDQMVQHGRQKTFPGQQWISKGAFWKSAFEVLPTRDRRSVLRFMKRHFQASDQKSHVWTEEQDAELIALVAEHGTKFAFIADMLGRSSDDVVQRWKNRLEHQDKRKTGSWSKRELDALQKALTLAWTRSKDQGLDVGPDIYEMDESLISWGQVSKAMGHVRSRQQCADKWRRLRNRLGSASLPNSRSATPTSSRKAKSAKYVESDGDDSDEQEEGVVGQGKGSTPPGSAKKSLTEEKRTLRKEDSSSESQSGSSSSSESESEKEQKQNLNPKAKSRPGSNDKGGAKTKGKTLPSERSQRDSASGSETEESESGEGTTTDESGDSSSEESGSTDDSESEGESENASANSANRDAQKATKRKRKREGSAQEDEIRAGIPLKMIKKEPTSDDEYGLQYDPQSEERNRDQKDGGEDGEADEEGEEGSDEEGEEETGEETDGDEEDDEEADDADHKVNKELWFTSKAKPELPENVPVGEKWSRECDVGDD
ncbi:hypothetical protein BJY01DRAFT_228923 [Aspergillus pseudoustus]|uniref:Myb-like domain-containing protein n=1 Tax=Aspergillus pseudoustus TaxID=1810923 RepID=A0ABR4IJB6_9EURO